MLWTWIGHHGASTTKLTKQLPHLVRFSRLVLLIFFVGNQLLQQFSDDLTAVFFRCFCTDSTNKQGFLYHRKPMAPAEKKKGSPVGFHHPMDFDIFGGSKVLGCDPVRPRVVSSASRSLESQCPQKTGFILLRCDTQWAKSPFASS